VAPLTAAEFIDKSSSLSEELAVGLDSCISSWIVYSLIDSLSDMSWLMLSKDFCLDRYAEKSIFLN